MDGEMLIGMLTDGVEKIFATMVQLNVRCEQNQEEMDLPPKHLTAMVGFAGTHIGLVSIHCSHEVTQKICGKMLNMTPGTLTPEDIRDALGEISNMIGGVFKSRFVEMIPGSENIFEQSIPSVISGEDYATFAITDAPRYCITVTSEENDIFYVELALKEA